MQQKGKLRYLISLWVALLPLFFIKTAFPLKAQNTIGQITVSDIDVTAFPDVSMQMQVFDTDGSPMAGLANSMVEVREDNGNVQVPEITAVSRGITIDIVADAGVGLNRSRWNKMNGVMTHFAQNYMVANVDQAALAVVEPNGLRSVTDYVSDPQLLTNAATNYQPPYQLEDGNNYSNSLEALNDLLDGMSAQANPTGNRRFIIFLTSGIETRDDAAASEVVNKARSAGVSIYVVIVREGNDAPPTFTSANFLATDTGGQYTVYAVTNSVNPAFERIASYRQQYDLTYRATNSTSGTHETRIAATSSGVESKPIAFELMVEPPRVLITSPLDGTLIERRALVYTEDPAAVEPTNETVAATVTFTDGHDRALVTAELLANNQVINVIRSPGIRFQIPWDLRDIRALGTSEYALQVRIVDELGLETISPALTTSVSLIIPPPENETVTEPTEPASSADPTTSQEDIDEAVSAAVAEALTCQSSAIVCAIEPYSTYFTFAFGLLSVVLGVMLWRNRGQVSVGVQNVARSATSLIERITRRSAPAQARAYLTVLDGDTNTGRTLDLYGDTPIGRSRQFAEILFQQNDENPIVSRLHCTIIDMEDHFVVQDEGSTHGTYLNNKALDPLNKVRLQDGDKIELGQLERGGIQLQFHVVSQTTGWANEAPESEGIDQPTELEDSLLSQNVPDYLENDPYEDEF